MAAAAWVAFSLALSGCASNSAATTQASNDPSPAGGTQPAESPSASPSPEPTAEPSPTTEPAPDCAQVKCIALTFDDGPWPETTAQLLDTLEREKVPATMFLVGQNAQRYPDLVEREQAMGLEIANHTLTHPNLKKSGAEKVRNELSQTNKILTGLTDTAPTLMRPPYGANSSTSDQISGELGLGVVQWTYSPIDWENKDAATITRLTVSGAEPNAIVLMHDTHTWTVDAVPQIITELRSQGYHFVTVTQLLGETTPGQVYS